MFLLIKQIIDVYTEIKKWAEKIAYAINPRYLKLFNKS